MYLPHSHSKILDPLGNPRANIFMSDNSKYCYETQITFGDVRLVSQCYFMFFLHYLSISLQSNNSFRVKG